MDNGFYHFHATSYLFPSFGEALDALANASACHGDLHLHNELMSCCPASVLLRGCPGIGTEAPSQI